MVKENDVIAIILILYVALGILLSIWFRQCFIAVTTKDPEDGTSTGYGSSDSSSDSKIRVPVDRHPDDKIRIPRPQPPDTGIRVPPEPPTGDGGIRVPRAPPTGDGGIRVPRPPKDI